jgi:GNAT superfamily N-acetyltransferase
MNEPASRHRATEGVAPSEVDVEVEVLALAEAARPDLLDEIAGVYAAAFGPPPWNEGAERMAAFRDRLVDDAARRHDGRLAVARRADGAIAGFATAWTTEAPFPTGRAYTAVADALGASVVERRLTGCREIDELAVHPDAQGLGLGRQLIEAIAPAGTPSWLLTSSDASAALHLYRSLGWDELTPTGAPIAVFATS